MIRLEQFRMTCPVAPVQFEGIDDEGMWWYFRSRHGEWSFTNGLTLEDAVGAAISPDRKYQVPHENGQLIAFGLCATELTNITAKALIDVLLTAVTE